MPARRLVWIALADRVLRDALIEQLDATPGLQAVDGGAGEAGMPTDPMPDAALVDADRLRSFRAASCPVIGIGRGPAGTGNEVIELPLRVGPLVARVHAAILESRARGARFHLGDAEFNHAQSCIRATPGKAHGLTSMESEVLFHLCRSGAREVSRDELLNVVWGYSPHAESHTVDTYIWRLRTILEKAGCGGILQTCEGGYRLEPPAVPLHDNGSAREGGGG